MPGLPPDYEKIKERRKRLEELGRELAGLLPLNDQWAALNERARWVWISRAHRLMRDQMRVQHDTRIRLIHRGYEEETGEISVPSWELDDLRAVVSFLGHELEHAWQIDVLLGRSDPPGGAEERESFEAAYADYDPTDAAKYADNALEEDARRRAEEVLDGYGQARPSTDS